MWGSTRQRPILYHGECRADVVCAHLCTIQNVEQNSKAVTSLPSRMPMRIRQRPLLYHTEFQAEHDSAKLYTMCNVEKNSTAPTSVTCRMSCRTWQRRLRYHIDYLAEIKSSHFCTMNNIEPTMTALTSVPCRVLSRNRQRQILYHVLMSSRTWRRPFMYHAKYRGELDPVHCCFMWNVGQNSSASTAVPCRMWRSQIYTI